MNKQQIESLQVQLYMQGYKGKDGKALSIDGQMGPNTAWAAQNMLRDKGYNLSVDGIWGTQSQNAYNNYSSKIYDSSLNREKPSSGIQNYTPAVNSQPKVNSGSSLVSSSAAAAQKQIYDSSVGRDWSGTVNQSYSSSPVQKQIYDSSVGKDWSGTVNQSYSSSPVQKESYDSSVGRDWSGTVNQNYSSTKPQSSAKSGTSRAYESLLQGSWPIAATEPKHSMGSTSSQKQQRDVIGEMLVEGLNELERILAAQSKEKAKLQPYQSLVQNQWPTLGQQSGIGARSLPQSSGKQDYVSRQVEKNLTEVLLMADAGAQQVFTSREAIAEEQEKLNLLGFYGQNGKPLREDGILDQDTLLAWNDKTYGGVLLGSNNSPMAKAQREWEKGEPMSVIGPVVFPIPASELTGELWDIVRTDGKAMQEFTNTEDVLRTKMELDTHGYTGPNKEKLTLNNVLDENTLYAWYVRESWEDPSHSFSEEIHDFVKKMEGQDEMEDEKWWVTQQLYVGLTNLAYDPVRLIYNVFMNGDYDPENAKNAVGRFFREGLVNQDLLNREAEEALAQFDDGTLGGFIIKNILAPTLEALPSMLLDAGIIAMSGGLAAPTLLTAGSTQAKNAAKLLWPATQTAARATRIAQTGAKVLDNATDMVQLIQSIMRHPITIERARRYFVDYLNQKIEKGMPKLLAAAEAAQLALSSAILDGYDLLPTKTVSTEWRDVVQKEVEEFMKSSSLWLRDLFIENYLL
ncbi:MAG: hypothetical protein IJP07_00495 [Firmicutes bacterium]|nr:hypothetical protein [Bacillota bacterium]